MEIQKTTGIVLSSKNSGDADIICNILTRDYGKRKFIFKGLKKSKKRSISSAEPGAVIDLQYYFHNNKDISIVNEANISRSYVNLRNNMDKIFHMFFLLESVEKTIGFNAPEKKIFDLLAAGMDTLSKNDFYTNLAVFFIIHLLKIHGLLPSFDRCKNCGSNNFSEFTFEIPDLRPVCGNCKKTKMMLGKECLQFFNESLNNKFNSIDHSAYKKEGMMDMLFNLSLFIENYFHIEINSKKFIFSFQDLQYLREGMVR